VEADTCRVRERRRVRPLTGSPAAKGYFYAHKRGTRVAWHRAVNSPMRVCDLLLVHCRRVITHAVRLTAGLILAVGSGGCHVLLNPTTTAAAPNAPITPAANEAFVVVARPAAWNPEGGKLRIVDEQRRVLADLGVGEHAVVRLPPGEHKLFAYEWSSGIEEPWCAGAMRATLGGGQVYPVRVAQYPTMMFHMPWVSVTGNFDCHRIELLRVPAAEHQAFWSWVRGSSQRREPLGEDRERSILLESSWRSERAVTAGVSRMSKGPAWSPAASVLSPADGDPTVP
jgi:hypothetical protein